MEYLICAGWLWDGVSPKPYENHAVCVEEGRIKDMGPAGFLKEKYPDASVREEQNWLILPGYVDAHDHGRGISPFWFGAKDESLEMWIPNLGRASAPVYEAALYDGTMLASSGVTTVVHCHNPFDMSRLEEELLDTVRGYNDAGIRVVVCPPYTDQNSLIYSRRKEFEKALPDRLQKEFGRMVCDTPLPLDDYFDLVENLKSRLSSRIKHHMADIQLHPVGGQWCSDRALLAMKEYACRHGMRVHMHLLETKYQMYYARDTWGKSMVAHLDEIGFLGPWLSCAHGVWLSDEDLERMARTGTIIVHNPSSNLRLRSGTMPLRKALDKNVVCALGLDGCGYDDDQDYGRELRTALYNNKQTGVDGAVTYEEVLRMALKGGQQVTGEKLSSGYLLPGGMADFVCLDYQKLTFPYADPEVEILSMVVRKGNRDLVTAVYCGGHPIIGDREDAGKKIETSGRMLRKALDNIRSGESRPVSKELLGAIHDYYEAWERGKE